MITIEPFFDQDTSTFTYVIYDKVTQDAIIIDPVLDFDPLTATISFQSLDRISTFVKEKKLLVHLVCDTHVHADHLSGAFFLKNRLGVKSAIGKDFLKSQRYFAQMYDIDETFYERAYDIFFTDEQTVSCGSLTLKAISTPGHTPTCSSYLIDNAIFVGDTLFQPTLGCGRTDFPGGSAKMLFKAVWNKIYSLPDDTQVFTGHDYPKDHALPMAKATLLDQKAHNVLLNQTISEEKFIIEREQRDQSLLLPRLFLFAMQVNLLGGQLPYFGNRNKKFMKIPLTLSFGE